MAAKIGTAIRAQRTQRRWSQALLAEHIGTSVELVSFLERGERMPSVATLIRLASALEVPIATLFGEQEHLVEKRDPAVALLQALPESARPLVIGMLRGALAVYRTKKKGSP
ncbi:MAG: helix-turn-helix transcriptional regulator [Polyangiaceae bacterium]|nr:helix-turn-helix transcriptional regulator [Polyangiaceae bacterium]